MGTLNERSGEYRLAREKFRKKILIIIAAVLAVLLVAYISWSIWNGIRNKEYHGYTVEKSYDRVDSNTVKYVSYGKNILKYSRDGAMAMDSDGNTLWNGSFEMQNPMIDCCGTYVAIADQGGKEIHVYSGSDSGTVIDAPLPIQSIRVASQGVVAVVLEDESSNTVNIYDPYSNSDKLLVEVPTNVKTDGYPVDIALSSDGQSLVTTYISVDSGVPQSKVCFYNFSEVGQDKNRIVGGKMYDSSIVSKLEYINDDTLCIFLDNGFSLFNNMKQPNEITTETFEQEIKSVIHDDGYVGFVFEKNDDDNRYNMKLYEADGNLALDTNVDYEYDRVYMSNSEITFLSGKGCVIIKTNGVCKFDSEFNTGVQYLYKANNNTSYYMIDERMINMIELSEDSEQ